MFGPPKKNEYDTEKQEYEIQTLGFQKSNLSKLNLLFVEFHDIQRQ